MSSFNTIKPNQKSSLVQRKARPSLGGRAGTRSPYMKGLIQGAGIQLKPGQKLGHAIQARRAVTNPLLTGKTVLQPKLKIGKPGDRYEMEADAVADRVVQRSTQRFNTGSKQVNKKEEEPAVQEKTEAPAGDIQREAAPPGALGDDAGGSSAGGEPPKNPAQTDLSMDTIAPKLQMEEEAVHEKCADCDSPVQKAEEEAQPSLQLEAEEPAQTAEEESQPSLQLEAEEPAQTAEEESQPSLQLEAEEPAQTAEEEAQPSLQMEAEEPAQTTEEESQPSLQLEAEESAQTAEEEAQPSLQLEAEEPAQTAEEEAQPSLQMEGDELGQMAEDETQSSLQMQGEYMAQTKDGDSVGTADLSSNLESSKGGGTPLPEDTKSEMEGGIGADFSNVRVHTGSDAKEMSTGLGAKAFTHGNDIYFNEGNYDTGSSEGKHLLAHELTHTVQQGAAPVQSKEEDETQSAEDETVQNKVQLAGGDEVQEQCADCDGPVQKEEEPETQASADPELGQMAQLQALIQREEDEEMSEEELKAQIEDSDKEAKEAIDPVPAQQAEKEAVAPNPELLQGPESEADGELTDKLGAEAGVPSEEEIPEGDPEAKAEENKKEKAGGEGKKGKKEVDPSLGKVGKELAETSAEVCPSAEEKTTELAANEQTHDDAGEKLAQTEGAVVPPAEEGQAMGNAGQVEEVEGNPEPEVSEEDAKAEFNDAVGDSVPSDIEEANEFKSEGKAKEVGNTVMGVVNKDVDAVKGTYNEMENEATPAEPSNDPQTLPETEEAPETPEMDLGKEAVPEPTEEQTDMSKYDKEAEEIREKEGIDEERLEMVDSGDLAEANKERKGLKKKVKEAPNQIKDEAKKKQAKVEKDMKSEEKKAKKEMKDKRKKTLQDTKGKQEKTKSDFEKKREAVTTKINGIYDDAKKKVTTKLENLEKVNKTAFAAGQKTASKTFENEVNRDINRWKSKRYSGIFGGAKWLKDKLFGIADFPEVKAAFDNARERYIKRIDKLISTINEANKKVIADCKQELANAKIKIKEYVDGLGPELKSAGESAAKEMDSKLKELDGMIDAKQKELTDKLCKAKDAAIKAIDEKIEKMKESMSGLVSMLGNLLLNALMKFFEWALTAAGKSPDEIMGIINKGKTVIKSIISDPIGFLMNIVNAVKKGIGQFRTNIKKHLLNGLVTWLTGSMGDADIQIPETFDLKGVMSLVMQVMGVTWDNIRHKLVKKIGEPAMAFAEGSVDVISRVVQDGPIALWDMLKEKADEIKGQMMEGIRNWVIAQVVKKGIIKLVSMLNPAGAIVQAILLIFDTVMFFVENWQSIVDFVNSIFDSIGDIAMGKIGSAANYIEQTMAMGIPLILNFLAKFIGLGGIGKAVKNVIKKIRKPVDKIMKKAIDKMAKMARKLFGKKKGKKGDTKDGKDKKDDKKGQPITEELGEKMSFSADGEGHKLWVKRGTSKGELFVASTPMPVDQKLDKWQADLSKNRAYWNHGKRKDKRARIVSRIKRVRKLLKKLDGQTRKAIQVRDKAAFKKVDKKIEATEKNIIDLMKGLFTDFGELDSIDFKAIYTEQLAKVHPKAKTKVDNSVDKINTANNAAKKGLADIKTWGGLRSKLEKTPNTSRLVSNPLNNNSAYGKYTKKQVLDAGKKALGAKYTATKGTNMINSIKGSKTSNAFIGLREQIFDKGKEADANTRIEKAYTSGMEHSEFDPVILSTTPNSPAAGKTTIVYKYKTGSERFTVVVDNASGLPDQVTGKSISKHTFGRGKTQGKTFDRHNRAHVIPNELKGSGYKTAHNLVVTSAQFNQRVMTKSEDAVWKRAIGYTDMQSFDLEVKVEYANPTTESAIKTSAIRKALKARHTKIKGATSSGLVAEAGTLAGLLAMSDTALRAAIAAKMGTIGQPRVMNVIYDITKIRRANGTSYTPPPIKSITTGPDMFYGT